MWGRQICQQYLGDSDYIMPLLRNKIWNPMGTTHIEYLNRRAQSIPAYKSHF